MIDICKTLTNVWFDFGILYRFIFISFYKQQFWSRVSKSTIVCENILHCYQSVAELSGAYPDTCPSPRYLGIPFTVSKKDLFNLRYTYHHLAQDEDLFFLVLKYHSPESQNSMIVSPVLSIYLIFLYHYKNKWKSSMLMRIVALIVDRYLANTCIDLHYFLCM